MYRFITWLVDRYERECSRLRISISFRGLSLFSLSFSLSLSTGQSSVWIAVCEKDGQKDQVAARKLFCNVERLSLRPQNNNLHSSDPKRFSSNWKNEVLLNVYFILNQYFLKLFL